MAKLLAWGPAGVFLLAVVDSAGVPLPGGVDVLLVSSVALHPHLAVWATVAAVAGSMIGCAILFWLARKGGQKYLEDRSQSATARRFRIWFDHYGLLTVFISALVPIPFPLKVFVISAGALGSRWRDFLGVLLLGRIPRYAMLAYLGVKLGEDSVEFLKRNAGAFMLGSLALFLFLIILIRLRGVKGPRKSATEAP